ncbi:Alternative oxidase, mitochondrial precursor [Xylographa parallela]|nr:Alternative oxidase, mitochondrial precursor [Xylographa parallela]
MYGTIRITKAPLSSKASAAKLTQAAQTFCYGTKPLSFVVRPSTAALQHNAISCKRPFSSTARTQLDVFPPPANAPNIKVTPPAWHHPVYTEKQMNDITIAHRTATTLSDKVALTMMRLLRMGMDFFTGYSHDHAVSRGTKNPAAARRAGWYGPMDERKWLIRCVFLESVAGVPGMVAASLRHLHSIRRLERDNGWIETLLEEAYNERMHLLTFLKMAEPGRFMRAMLLGAQGVWYNALFFAYLLSPRTCHRFVGYLEEEAVITYTRFLAEIDAGNLPLFEKTQAPEIAVRYWNMPEGKRGIRDLILYIRADEAKHREVNHTLGNLAQREDPNPFVSEYKDEGRRHPGKGIENIKGTGWEREDVI